MTTCALLGGAVNLNNYQLDGEYAINELLAPAERIQLVNYVNADQSAAALLNTPDWLDATTPPAPKNYALTRSPTYYRGLVDHAGSGALLRQAYVQAVGHCNFTPSEPVAGVHTLQQRIATGQWGRTTTAANLNAASAATGYGPSAFITYSPAPFVNARYYLR